MANNLYDFVTIEAQKHQEALEKQGFYTDDTPVEPLEDELKNIKSPLALQYADWIRTKSHGADILESQARWGLLMAKQALDAIEQSGDAKRVAKDLTNRFNAQIGSLTTESEWIDARGGREVLSVRLNQLEDNMVYSSIDELKKSYAPVGAIVKTLGYFDVYDDGGASYKITDEALPQNDISIFKLNSGLTAKIVSINGINPQMFGILGSELEEESNVRWSDYLNYVNNTDMAYFDITTPVDTDKYLIYKPLLIKKSFIGRNTGKTPMIRYQSATPQVVDSILTTSMYFFPYNVKAVIAVNTPNLGNPFEFKNFVIECNGMDYGLYIPETIRMNVEGIRVVSPKRIGVYILSTWMSTMSRVEVFNSSLHGILVGINDSDGGQTKTGTSTSFNISSCYVNKGSGFAYKFYGLQYSDISSLACDNFRGVNDSGANAIYLFEACKGLTVNSVGAEKCKALNLLYLSGSGGITVNTPYFLNCEFRNSMISVANPVARFNGAVSISNPAIIDGIDRYDTASSAKRAYYFDITSLVTLTTDSTKITMTNGETLDVVFGTNQKFYNEISQDSKRLVNGAWKYFVTSDTKPA